MTELGEISVNKELVIEWSIKDFLSLPFRVGSYHQSPRFSFRDISWYLRIYLNGEKGNGSEGFFNLCLCITSPDSSITVECTSGVKNTDGKLDPERSETFIFKKIKSYRGTLWLNRANLLEWKSDILPSDTLTLVCRVKNPELNEFSTDFSHSQDFKKMLLDGKNHDLILKVGDKELHAHQDVLSARSQVFQSMLSHDTIEKKNGVIDIPDCDPEAMEMFLSYVYSGKIDSLDEANMLKLFYIADKYDLPGLKDECCKFIKKSLSYTNFCEVIQLALKHSDMSLLECSTEYFMDNTVDIMVTAEWQSFLKNNSTMGNELLLKSFQKLKESKN